jgi:chorismate mutase
MPQPDSPPIDLASVRTEIDRIDRAILDLMEERLAMSAAVARIKGDQPSAHLLLHPDREQDVLHGLFARAKAMQPAMIDTIWRELMAANLQTQRRTEIVLHAVDALVRVTDQARRRFGVAAPLLVADSAQDALARARAHEAVAVIEIAAGDWWTALAGDDGIAIFDGLRDGDKVIALAIGRIAPGRSADIRFPILDAAALAARRAAGETLDVLAEAGDLRLCIAGDDA